MLKGWEISKKILYKGCLIFVIIAAVTFSAAIMPAAAVCVDNDGDGYGNPGDASCAKGNKPDCDDTDFKVYPGAPKICDGKDNNCDGIQDFSTDIDKDADGVMWCASDCDDNNANRSPLKTEGPFGSVSCADGIDNDCDLRIDASDPGCMVSSCIDNDGDGYGRPGHPVCPKGGLTDCNDNDPALNPDAADTNCDGTDNNCNGVKDEGYVPSATLCGVGICAKTGQNICQNGTVVDTCTPGTPFPDDTSCDNLDNNCNGQTDEGFIPVDTTCGLGICGSTGQNFCQNGTVISTCVPNLSQTEGPSTDPTCSDNLDNDCDGFTDGVDPNCNSGNADMDGDGQTPNGGDCDDTDPKVYPGASKICDGKDNNCDGIQDFVTDADKDSDGVLWCGGDCDDNNSKRSPLKSELYGSAECADGIDNDCDNRIDMSDTGCQNPCIDKDSDGYGSPGSPYCLNGGATDCDDYNPGIRPGAPDTTCNSVDENCSGIADEGYAVSITTCGTGPCSRSGHNICQNGSVVNTCVPGTPGIEGFAAETCYDGIDNDCDGTTDGVDMDCTTVCVDADNDGYGANGSLLCPYGTRVDCNDNDPNIHPWVSDSSCNGIDENCSGTADEGYAVVPTNCGTGACARSGQNICQNGTVVNTCSPGTPGIEGPYGNATCADGSDNDCDGTTDGADLGCTQICLDNDGDGYGNPGNPLCPKGTVNDCDDSDNKVYPGAPKICDGKDNNCDRIKDFASDEDKDHDGVMWCANDCDDNNPNRYPGNIEAPSGSPVCMDGIDNDCDLKTDATDSGCKSSCIDTDGDGYGCPADPACSRGAVLDCNCTNSSINPGALDTNCNGVDENCSGLADEGYVPTQTTCGVGACASTGQNVCQNGTVVNTCVILPAGTEGPYGDSTCADGIDNNCNGLTDVADGIYCESLCIDNDGDGYGSNVNPLCPGGQEVDCDDNNANVNPGKTDTNCNGVDENCSGTPDEGYVPIPPICGVGVCATTGQNVCQNGTVVNTCVPLPAGTEGPYGHHTCADGLDNDCDGNIDNFDSNCQQTLPSCFIDNDGDGYPGWVDPYSGCTIEFMDCNDNDPLIKPFVTEICGDYKDNNCDGQIDNCICIDNDGDGYGANGNTLCPNGPAVDCNDSNVNINPGKTDTNCNGVDENCSGAADEGYVATSTTCGTGVCSATGQNICQSGTIVNTCTAGTPQTENYAVTGTCTDSLDNDCDSGIDEFDGGCVNPCMTNSDCSPAAYCSKAIGDCSGAGLCQPRNVICTLEMDPACGCDGITYSNACAGAQAGVSIAHAGQCTLPPLCIDNDNDGFGANGHATCPNGTAVDCNDNDVNINPGMTDANCNGVDENCSGAADEGYVSALTTCGTGACSASGQLICQSGAIVDTCLSGAPLAEDYMVTGTCGDGTDNDCDGATDLADSGCAIAAPHNDQACNSCHVTPDTFVPDANIPDSACQTCHAAGAIGSSLKVDRHYSQTYVDPSTGILADIRCVECHNTMSIQSNLKLIRGTIRSRAVVFTAYTGANSFADGGAPYDGVCEVCHTQTAHHQNDGTAPGGQSHQDGSMCTACHFHDAGFLPQINCLQCHSQTPPEGSSDTRRRQIAEAAAGDGSGDFVRTSHHVVNGPSSSQAVNQDVCLVCHDQTNHKTYGDGVSVLLKDQDTGAPITYNGTGSAIEAFCLSCHDANGSTLYGATPFNQSGSGDISSPVNIGWTIDNAPHKGNSACFNCHGDTAGNNAHGSQNVKMLKQNNYVPGASQAFCYTCHNGTGIARNIEALFTRAYTHGSRDCQACHDQHKVKSGTHANANQWYPNSVNANTNDVSKVLSGVTGVQPTWPAIWTAPTAFTTEEPSTKEYQICLKCHSKNNGGGTPPGTSTDQALEFNPNNKSAHPVVVTLNNQTGSTSPKALQSGQMSAPWTAAGNQTMMCSDCHGADAENAGDPKGPHGSAARYMLKGAGNLWPYKSDGTTMWRLNTTDAQNTQLFCKNCHPVYSSGWKNNVHSRSYHYSNSYTVGGQTGTGVPCVVCHITVPHGSKRSRLITYSSDSAPYNFNNRISGFRKASTPTTYSKSNCYSTVSGCTTHSSSGTYEQ